MSNRAGTYLQRILTESQHAEYRRLAALDSRDSAARQRWRYLARMRDYPQTNTKSQETARAWLRRHGYMAADGTRLGPELDARGR